MYGRRGGVKLIEINEAMLYIIFEAKATALRRSKKVTAKVVVING